MDEIFLKIWEIKKELVGEISEILDEIKKKV